MSDLAITQLLQRAREGDGDATNQLLPLVYRNLRQLAAAKMKQAGPGQTLQPTALVHEAFLRSLGADTSFENRRHFFFVAARAMRDILVEQARRTASAKRGGDQVKVSADDLEIAVDTPAEELIALHEALHRLEVQSPRSHEIVLLRFFGGLSAAEVAETLGVGLRTVERDWRFARAYLHEVLASSS